MDKIYDPDVEQHVRLEATLLTGLLIRREYFITLIVLETLCIDYFVNRKMSFLADLGKKYLRNQPAKILNGIKYSM